MTALRRFFHSAIAAMYGACTGHSTGGITCATRSYNGAVRAATSAVYGRTSILLILRNTSPESCRGLRRTHPRRGPLEQHLLAKAERLRRPPTGANDAGACSLHKPFG